jgi:hypothetical protein
MKNFFLFLFFVVIVVTTIWVTKNFDKIVGRVEQKVVEEVFPKSIQYLLDPEITPEPLPDPEVIAGKVRSLFQLNTLKQDYDFKAPVSNNANQKTIWGALTYEDLTVTGFADAIFGIDLQNFSEENVQIVDADTVRIYLPRSQVLYIVVDNNRTWRSEQNSRFLTQPDPLLETRARQIGQEKVRMEAERDIPRLREADENAKKEIGNFLRLTEDLEFVFSDEPLNTMASEISVEEDSLQDPIEAEDPEKLPDEYIYYSDD